MLVYCLLFLCVENAFAQTKKTNTESLFNLVNPFIGTGGHGHTFPGPTMPFGACQVGPDTRLEGWDGCSGYHYSDSVIYGFSHTHLSGTGCSDYGDILLMPVTKEMQLDKYQYASHFLHANEKAHAGYYQVFLDDPKINVELTTTLHGGMHQYTFQKNDEQFVVLDLKHRDRVLDSKMEKVDDYTIRGYRFSKAWANNQKLFYEIKFSKKIEGIIYEPVKSASQTTFVNTEKSLHCLIKFQIENSKGQIPNSKNNSSNSESQNPNSKLQVQVGISGVDEEGAHKNLLSEMPNWDFDLYKNKCEQEWEKELSKITISQLADESSSQLADEQISQFADESNSQFADEKLSRLDNSGIEQLKNTNNQHIGTSANRHIIFYTALYHCMIHPSLYSDIDGRYRGRDDKIHNTEGKFNYYTVFSLWDTYRALHPLLTILDKKRTNDFINTFIKQYEQCGRLPIWELSSNETNCMIGYHVVSVMWDAYNKGIRDYDVNKAFEAMKSIATQASDYVKIPKGEIPNSKGGNSKSVNSKNQNPNSKGVGVLTLKEEAKKRCADADALESYNRYGYVRSDDAHESVSKTLEFAYDDWCIAQMANALGKKKDYEYYTHRSHYWLNVYDPTTGFMRARKNGCLYEPFSPYTVDNNFTEANSWQYSFYVPHDINSLISHQGGKDGFEKKLDDLFAAKTKTEGREQADITGLIGQYAHGNEPSHQMAYLYNWIFKPEKTEKIVNKIMNEFYKNEPDGLIGNEDCGQMSAWYVMNQMGIYQMCPGGHAYFEKSKRSIGVQMEGKKLETILTDLGKFANSEYSFNDELLKQDFIYSPFLLNAKRIFKDSLKLVFGNNEPKDFDFIIPTDTTDTVPQIYYSINNSAYKRLDDNQITIKENSTIHFYNRFKVNYAAQQFRRDTLVNKVQIFTSPIQTATFTKLPTDRKIILKSEYNKSYGAGGPEGLMDGIYGKLNWRAGDWQGYQGQDVEVIMAFDKATEIKSIGANFLEDQNSWIFYPSAVSFYTSNDSIKWTLVKTIPTNKPDHDENVSISKWQTSITPQKVNYIKVIAKSFGKMPEWHEGRGNNTYIFLDEVEVK